MPRASQAKGMPSFPIIIFLLATNAGIPNQLTFLFQLRDMKCSIDNKCPRAASHLKTKAKKNALMEDRFAQIETENRLLLEKMSHIMRVSWYTWTCHRKLFRFPLVHKFILLLVQRGHRLPKRIGQVFPFVEQRTPKTRTVTHYQRKPTDLASYPKCSACLFTYEMGGGGKEEW